MVLLVCKKSHPKWNDSFQHATSSLFLSCSPSGFGRRFFGRPLRYLGRWLLSCRCRCFLGCFARRCSLRCRPARGLFGWCFLLISWHQFCGFFGLRHFFLNMVKFLMNGSGHLLIERLKACEIIRCRCNFIDKKTRHLHKW